MRQLHTLALLVLCSLVLAQAPYRPFPEGEAGWLRSHSWDEPFTDCGSFYRWFWCSNSLQFGQDSTINGTTYNTVYEQSNCQWQVTNPISYPSWCVAGGSFIVPHTLVGFIRQDIGERKVYYRPVGSLMDELLYDFTMGLGPYPDTYNNPWQDQLHVLDLDSMELNDGWHRAWVLGIVWNGQVWDSAFAHVIEGVGSTLGLLNSLQPPLPTTSDLICHSASGSTLYPLGTSACGLSVHVLEEVQKPALLAWPNPVQDLIHFEQPVSGRIFDAQGRTVRDLPNGTTQNVQTLRPGMYMLRTLQGAVLRFVKE